MTDRAFTTEPKVHTQWRCRDCGEWDGHLTTCKRYVWPPCPECDQLHDQPHKLSCGRNPKSPKSLETQVGGDHYARCAIQPIEYIFANGLGFAEGAVVKYVTRYQAKGGVEDLRKARHFLDMLIEHVEGRE